LDVDKSGNSDGSPWTDFGAVGSAGFEVPHRQDGPSDEKQMAASATVKARSIANLKLKTLHLRSLKELSTAKNLETISDKLGTDKLLHSKNCRKLLKKYYVAAHYY
jgi:hypothetical protein